MLFLPLILASGSQTPRNYFEFRENVLNVDTARLVLRIEGGAVSYVQDKATSEVLLDADPYVNRPTPEVGFVGFTSEAADATRYARWPTRASSVSFRLLSPEHAQLVYSGLGTDPGADGSQLIADVTVDTQSGEVVVQTTGSEGVPGLSPVSVDLPVTGLATRSVILGNGAKCERQDAEAIARSSYSDFGLNGPTMAVAEGQRSSLAVWSESFESIPEYVELEHRADYDHVVLHAERSAQQTEQQRIVSPAWRLGTYPTWVDVAHRWRTRFEAITGAHPLWENRANWVRNVHAIYDATNQWSDEQPARLAELAAMAEPDCILYFVWNGDRIVLYGDPTLVNEIDRPKPEEIQVLANYGWPLLLYHPYNLIYSEIGTTNRLNLLASNGWLPPGYEFRPDFDCTPDCWQSYWSGVKASYYDGSQFEILHPGSTRFRNYLLRNLGDYVARYGANGAYLDILGDVTNFFTGTQATVEGQDYTLGEVSTLISVTQTLPDIGIMSEYQPSWLVPFSFYSWEGPTTHLMQMNAVNWRVNHPLRVALLGSYSWTRESNAKFIDDRTSALMGALPEVSLVGDHGVSDERAQWSQARARLFCEERLFNDLPDRWEAGVLAYYRSARTGHWFEFRDFDNTTGGVATGENTYGYVEVLPSGERVIRLAR
jgi:hypothetical protein